MSSKNAEPASPAATPEKPARVWSVTRRFTVLYLASTAVLLLLAEGFLYSALQTSLFQRAHTLLGSKVRVLRLLLRAQADKTDVLASEVEHEASGPLSYYMRILDEQGRVLLESPGMTERLPAAVFSAAEPAIAEPLAGIEHHVHPHESFLLVSARAPVGTAGHETRTVQVALDISSDLALLADYRRTLLTVLGVGLLFAAAVGGWLARKGAQPLVEMTESARQVTASRLEERIAVLRWPAELAELALAFNSMLDRLEESFTRLSQFSADLAHELRTPINNLRGETEVALARSRTPAEYQQALASNMEEYERLSRMIDDLLFVARADNPKAVVKPVRFDARKEIDAVRDFYEALAEEQKVDLICEGQAWMNGDPMLFRRAVSNLVANAIQHTLAEGSVRISLYPLDSEALDLRVRDTGSGIASEHLPRVFDRFYRGDSCRPHAPGGSGLGLAIVRSIMHLHGGTASVESLLGHGTTVILKFPAAARIPTLAAR